MLLKYLALLRYNHALARLSAVQLICYFGAWFSHTGIFTLLIELKAPVWALSSAAMMAFLPSIVLAPFNGIIIDKLPKRTLMLALMLTEALSVLALLLIDSLDFLWLLMALIFIRMGVGTLFFQTEMSLLPSLLAKPHLIIANEIHSMIFAFSYTAGMGLAGIFVHFYGIKASFLFDFALYSLGIFILFGTRFREPALQNAATGALKMFTQTFYYIKSKPVILHLIFLHALVGLFAYDTIVALLVDYEYKGILSVALAIGFLNTARAFALCVGPVLLSRFVSEKNMIYFLAFQGLCIMLWACLESNFYTSLLGIFLAAFFCNSIWSYTFTRLQTACDSAFYGRIVAYNDMVFFIIASLVASGVGLAFELGFSLPVITGFIGVLFILGSFYYAWVRRKYFEKDING